MLTQVSQSTPAIAAMFHVLQHAPIIKIIQISLT